METTQMPPHPRHPVLQWLDGLSPFWAPQLVVLATILLGFALPGKVTVGPNWLLPAFEGGLLIGLAGLSPHPRMRESPWRRRLTLGLIALVSGANIFSLIEVARLLVHGHPENGRSLIGAGAVLWLTNVLLFGLYYWELDRGGPQARRRGERRRPDFLFPQMTEPRWAPEGWKPGIVDYLYVSFTNATAFSPTDTMPLTAPAKWLMSAQALTALVTVGLVVARAVNILPSSG